MLDVEGIRRLYANVLHNDIVVNQISATSVRHGIQNMAHVYAKEAASFENSSREVSNFNDAAFRCAYLHKYAPLHTYVVIDVTLKLLHGQPAVFHNLMAGSGRLFKFCCVGGGPGTDAVGVLAALQLISNTVPFLSSATIVDCMENWQETFSSIVRELRYGDYGVFWRYLNETFQWSYLGCDLLERMTNDVNKAVGSASLVTMVKFISAAACKDTTQKMVEKIFRVMKPGALVLYIDNAAGGFTQVIERACFANRFRIIVALRHLQYLNEDLKQERFGYISCFKTTVTAMLLQKPMNANLEINSRMPLSPNANNVPQKKQKVNVTSPAKSPAVSNAMSSAKIPAVGNAVSPAKIPAVGNARKPLAPANRVNETSPTKSSDSKVRKTLLPNNCSNARKPVASSAAAVTQPKFLSYEDVLKSTGSAQFRSSNPNKLPKKVNANRNNARRSQTKNTANAQCVSDMSSPQSNAWDTAETSAFLRPAPSNNAPAENRYEDDESEDQQGCSCCVIS